MSFIVNVLVTIIIANAGFWQQQQQQQQVALAQTILMPRAFFKVSSFHDNLHLPPNNTWQQELAALEPALGRVFPLEISRRPKSSRSMSTVFHIYRADKSTRDIRFRANSPHETLAGILGEEHDLKHDYQYDLERLAESGFEVMQKTVILTSGFMTSDEEKWAVDSKDLLLELYQGNVNVIIVGWADSNRPLYEQAVANTVFVARQIIILLHYLAQLSGTSLKDQDFLDTIHLVGHSCGAHISGFVGKDVGGRIGRITGLDPAGPTFDTLPASQRLDRSDAQLVEVLHTNAGHMHYKNAIQGIIQHTPMLLNPNSDPGNGPSFGIDQKIGHIDYFANDGHDQEGCTRDKLNICDHGRATEIFVDVLRFERYLRAADRSGPHLHFRNRLWAFRASDFETFESGDQLLDSCPHLMSVESHLNPHDVAKSFRQCAVPLLDILTPVHRLIKELRDDFQVSFEPSADQDEERPSFYFRTQTSAKDPAQFMGDHYLLKVYLDPNLNEWDAARCSLSAELRMNDGQKLTIELGKLDSDEHAVVVAPFVHPAGPGAHVALLELVSLLTSKESKQSSKSQERISELFLELFPRMTTLKFVTKDPRTLNPTWFTRVDFAPSCQIRIKGLEVHPINVYTPFNLGALYGVRSLEPGQEIEFVSAKKFAGRLKNWIPGKRLTPGYWYEAKLESALLDRPTKKRARIPRKPNVKHDQPISPNDNKQDWLGSFIKKFNLPG